LKFSIITVVLSLISFILNASEEPILDSLTEDMAQVAQSATETNYNVDYQPFILSTWEQKDLFAFGARTLKDALMLVPGIDMMADTMNNRTPVIRGSNPLAYGQTKLAIDGIVINDRTFDSYNGYLDLPIELIQRIEIVRGSGSFIEGVNGYSGTINVITYAKDEGEHKKGAVFGGFGSNSAEQAGFWYTHRAIEWKLSTDLFYQNNDAKTPIPVTDKYRNIGFAPLNSRQIGIGMAYQYGDFSLKGRFNQFKSGSAFGNLNALPNADGMQSTPSWYIEGQYKHKLSDHLNMQMKTGIMEDGWESSARSLPPGTYGAITFPTGYWAFLKFNSRLIYGNLSTTYTGFDHHTLILGFTQKYEDAIDMSSITTNRLGGSTFVDYTYTAPFLDQGSACRHTNEFYLSDTIDISEKLALSLYAGGTKASNIKFNTYERAALVYQPYRRHILKLMAGNSYRLPSWQEMYTLNNPARIGNPTLRPEHVVSYEAQYLYKPTAAATVGINVFYLQNKDQIATNTATTIYQNIGERNILGYETEFRGSLGDNDSIALSYSYITGDTTKANITTDYLPYASQHLLKAAFSYALTPELKAGAVGRYASEKERRPNDRTSAMNSFTTLDLILGWENKEGLYLQGSLKDVANNIYRYPSPPSTYPDDYPVEGRTFWLRAGWKY
jgi:outer membrane receptor for ferrienterochelin and colicins